MESGATFAIEETDSEIGSVGETTQDYAGGVHPGEGISEEKKDYTEENVSQFGGIYIKYTEGREGYVSEAIDVCGPLADMARDMPPDVFYLMAVAPNVAEKKEIVDEEILETIVDDTDLETQHSDKEGGPEVREDSVVETGSKKVAFREESVEAGERAASDQTSDAKKDGAQEQSERSTSQDTVVPEVVADDRTLDLSTRKESDDSVQVEDGDKGKVLSTVKGTLVEAKSRSWREPSRLEQPVIEAQEEIVALPSPPLHVVRSRTTSEFIDSSDDNSNILDKVTAKPKSPAPRPKHTMLDSPGIGEVLDQAVGAEIVGTVRDDIDHSETDPDKQKVAPFTEAVAREETDNSGEIPIDREADREVIFFERTIDAVAREEIVRDDSEVPLAQPETVTSIHREEGGDDEREIEAINFDEILQNTLEGDDSTAKDRHTLVAAISVQPDVEPVRHFEAIQELTSGEEAIEIEVALAQIAQLAEQGNVQETIPPATLKTIKKLQKHLHVLKEKQNFAEAKQVDQELAKELSSLLRSLGYKNPEQLLAPFLERHSIEYLMKIFGSVVDVSHQPQASRRTLSAKLKSFIATKIGKHALMKSLLGKQREFVVDIS